MANTKSFYLPDDVLEVIAGADNGSAYITQLVRRDAHQRQEHALQTASGVTEDQRMAARLWASEQFTRMRNEPVNHAGLRERFGIPKA
jgi:ubiquinone biosynthesis protein UbiJ